MAAGGCVITYKLWSDCQKKQDITFPLKHWQEESLPGYVFYGIIQSSFSAPADVCI